MFWSDAYKYFEFSLRSIRKCAGKGSPTGNAIPSGFCLELDEERRNVYALGKMRASTVRKGLNFRSDFPLEERPTLALE